MHLVAVKPVQLARSCRGGGEGEIRMWDGFWMNVKVMISSNAHARGPKPPAATFLFLLFALRFLARAPPLDALKVGVSRRSERGNGCRSFV